MKIDTSKLCLRQSPMGYPICSLAAGHDGPEHIAYRGHDPHGEKLLSWPSTPPASTGAPVGSFRELVQFANKASADIRQATEQAKQAASTGAQEPHIHSIQCYFCGHDDCPCRQGWLHEELMCGFPATAPAPAESVGQSKCHICNGVNSEFCSACIPEPPVEVAERLRELSELVKGSVFNNNDRQALLRKIRDIASLLRSHARETREYVHWPECNGDRRFPAGDPGHCCSCFNDKHRPEPPVEVAERLKEIEARCEKAVPGEWQYRRDGNGDRVVEVVHTCSDPKTCYLNEHHSDCIGGHVVFRESGEWNRMHDEANFDFAAHARTDIPYLLSLLRSHAREPFPHKGECPKCGKPSVRPHANADDAVVCESCGTQYVAEARESKLSGEFAPLLDRLTQLGNELYPHEWLQKEARQIEASLRELLLSPSPESKEGTDAQ